MGSTDISSANTDTELIESARAAIAACSDDASLADAKSKFLGKDGALTVQMKSLGKLPPQEKGPAGKRLNQTKKAIEALLNDKEQELASAKLNQRLSEEAIDVTLPGRGSDTGGLHPLTITIARIEEIFRSNGFDVADGPEIEEDFYNFAALNTPENHPARSMHDTFYVDIGEKRGEDGGLLLRTHTSPMQIRYARMHKPPIKVIAPGKTYRVDSDATHSPMFHQVEGLWIDRNINLTDLKSVYADFLAQFFRPSYFPFTEPSAEIDMRFADGPLAGKWLEVSGSGQVHPEVVRNIGLDPEEFIGFAFGSGVERLAMLRYGIGDLRLFYENDLRFLQQFSHSR